MISIGDDCSNCKTVSAIGRCDCPQCYFDPLSCPFCDFQVPFELTNPKENHIEDASN